MFKNYRDLKVWPKSYALCLDLYGMTKKFPKEERYGLTSQISSKTTADYLRSLYIAYGSVCEWETQVLLSGDLNYVNKENLTALKDDTAEVERMLKALIKSLENKRLDP